jgi:hypothetical protein
LGIIFGIIDLKIWVCGYMDIWIFKDELDDVMNEMNMIVD